MYYLRIDSYINFITYYTILYIVVKPQMIISFYLLINQIRGKRLKNSNYSGYLKHKSYSPSAYYPNRLILFDYQKHSNKSICSSRMKNSNDSDCSDSQIL